MKIRSRIALATMLPLLVGGAVALAQPAAATGGLTCSTGDGDIECNLTDPGTGQYWTLSNYHVAAWDNSFYFDNRCAAGTTYAVKVDFYDPAGVHQYDTVNIKCVFIRS